MPSRGAETERLQRRLRDLGGVDLRESEGPRASRAELREQLLQTRSAIVDERAERYNRRLPRLRQGSGEVSPEFALGTCRERRGIDSVIQVKKVGLDSLVGGDGESCDVVLPCGQRLDRSLPAHLRVS